MQFFDSWLKAYAKMGADVLQTSQWNWFIRAVALAFLAFWIHLGYGINDWLGTDGFHLTSSSSLAFPPLPSPWPTVLWYLVLFGTFLMFSKRTALPGCALAGMGFFYATMCDPASIAALNMHFLFGFAVILWSCLIKPAGKNLVSAWPAYIVRLYLVVVYFCSGWRKVIYGNWLDTPDALLRCMTGFFTTDLTRFLYLHLPNFTWTFLQYFSVGFELGAPLLLLYPPLRKWGVLSGCLLHLGIALLMKDLFYFSFQMLTFYIPFLIPISPQGEVAPSKRDHQSAM